MIPLLIGAYFLGAIPVGYLVARAKGIDILQFGSGNIGATNVHRALGKWLGLLVFVLDVLKGLIPAVLAYYLFKDQVYSFAAGMGAVVGHCLSPFLKFKGGKGIATGLGAMLGSSPIVAGVALAAFLLTMILTRYVSLSSIVAALTIVPMGIASHARAELIWAFGALAVFIIYKHRANIGRLQKGTEPKFALSKSSNGEAQVSSRGLMAVLCLLLIFASSLVAASSVMQLR